MENIEKLIGKKVKEARLRLGISQSTLAENAKTSLTTINRLEKGRQFPHNSTLTDIAKALGLSTSDLYSNEPATPREESPGRASLILEIQDLLKELPQDDLETLKMSAESLKKLSQSKTSQKAE